MAQEYDKILKENILEVFLPLTKKILGFQILQTRELPHKLQTTIEREPDFLKIIKTETGEEFIFHLEFQTTDEKEMVKRMQEYHGILSRIYKYPIKHFVLYMGDTKPKMRTSLERYEVFEGFDLICLLNYDYTSLISSDIPEEIILAVLANFKNDDPVKVISEILKKLKEKSKDEISLKKYVRQLGILSRLRNLGYEIKKQAENMTIIIDIEKDAFYQMGIEKGIKKGLEEGIEKGIEKGIEIEKNEMILAMLKDKTLSLERIAKIAKVSLDYVQKLAVEIKD